MRALLTIAIALLFVSSNAQDTIHIFEATQVNVNKKGEKFEATTPEPSKITLDLSAGTITLNTSNPEVRELLKEDLVFDIDKQLGEMGDQYSFQVDQNVLMHFFLDSRMILITRNDIHPLQWGIQFLEVEMIQ